MDIPAYVQTEDSTLIRDTRSKALLSTDRVGLARHRATRAQRQQQKQQSHDIEDLKAQVAHLTALVSDLLARLSK